MKQMDEMDRNLKLHSEEFGFKTAVLILAVYTLFEGYKNIFNYGSYNPLPGFILITVLCVQRFSEMSMKRKMIAGDDEYKEPNKLLWSIVIGIAVFAVILSIGSFLLFNLH